MNNLLKVTIEEFQEDIELQIRMASKKTDNESENSFDGERMPNTMLVRCNDITKIISSALAASKKVKGYTIYFQPNIFHIEINKFFSYEYQKQCFTDFCNYMDKYNEVSIRDFKKTFINYSKNSQKEVFAEYPLNVKMILIVEDFNLWNFNSQYIIAKLSQNPNIVVIGQIRTDLDFAIKHLDPEAVTFASHMELDV